MRGTLQACSGREAQHLRPPQPPAVGHGGRLLGEAVLVSPTYRGWELQPWEVIVVTK